MSLSLLFFLQLGIFVHTIIPLDPECLGVLVVESNSSMGGQRTKLARCPRQGCKLKGLLQCSIAQNGLLPFSHPQQLLLVCNFVCLSVCRLVAVPQNGKEANIKKHVIQRGRDSELRMMPAMKRWDWLQQAMSWPWGSICAAQHAADRWISKS